MCPTDPSVNSLAQYMFPKYSKGHTWAEQEIAPEYDQEWAHKKWKHSKMVPIDYNDSEVQEYLQIILTLSS